MTFRIVEALVGFITAVISAMGYGGVVLLMAVESACIPLPSEITMPFAGYLAYRGEMSLQGAALAGAIGCVVGSVPAYYLGMLGGRPLIERYGRYLLVSRRDLDLADRLFRRFGQWVVLAGRLLPVVRTFIAFPAGVARMPKGRFLAYTFVGSYPWCLVLAWAGKKLGEAWHTDPRLRDAYHRFELVIVVAAALSVVAFVAHKLREARRDRAGARAAGKA
ncbi:MAG TPA: DedA family protein [Anaeromyxobacter sp.]|nr:DedA family protein [Anaeromyxobacter sp.]